MFFATVIILTAAVLIGSLPLEIRAETLARLDFANLIEHRPPRNAGKDLAWLQVGPPDLSQWEAQGFAGVRYKVWFEQGIGWRVQKDHDGNALLELTAVSEREAKNVAVLDHG